MEWHAGETEDLSTNGTNARQSKITNDTPYHNPKEVSGPRIPEGDFCKQRPVESRIRFARAMALQSASVRRTAARNKFLASSINRRSLSGSG
jgi:hypothetical protein